MADSPRKSENFHIRLPQGEKKAFKKAAERARLSLTVWTRLVLRRAAGLDVPTVLLDENNRKK